jgi:hypothetical protein
MLWSGNDSLIGVAIADGQHPCPAALADDRPGLSVEAAVRHSLLDAGFYNNMNPVTDLKSLDNGGAGRYSALS